MSTDSKFKYKVCVVGGCGHVGLPLAIMLANRNLKTCIYDINQNSIAKIKEGVLPFYEEGAQPLLESALESGNLDFTTRAEVIGESEIVIVIIGTPVDEH